MEPTFSIVVPCHNYARYLTTTLDSVVAQGRDDVEVIVVDDASTDDSAEIAARYGDPVQLVRLRENRGPAGAWYAGLQRTRGAYVCKLDADDWQLPGYLDLVADAFAANPGAGMVATGAYIYPEGTGAAFVERPTAATAVLGPAELRDALLRKFFARMPATALRREALSGHAPPRDDLRLPHDWEYFLRVLRGWGASLHPEPLAVYRVHAGSLTLTTSRDQRLQTDLRRLIAVTSVPDDPAYLEPSERRRLAVGAGEAYLGSVGPRLATRDLRGAWRHLSFAFSLAASGSVLGVARLLRYVVWGVWQRMIVRPRRSTVPIEQLMPRSVRD